MEQLIIQNNTYSKFTDYVYTCDCYDIIDVLPNQCFFYWYNNIIFKRNNKVFACYVDDINNIWEL